MTDHKDVDDLDTSTQPTDVSKLLSLQGPGARAIVGVFMVSNFIFTFANIDLLQSHWPSIIAMIVVNIAALLLVQPHPDPFPLRETLIAVGAVVVSTALISWQLPLEGPPARTAWHLGANTWLVFFLALRRRGGWAWIGLGLMTAITILWAVDTGRGVGGAITLVQTHIGILLVASLFASNLRRTSARINALNERSVHAAASSAAADAAQEVRQQRFAELATAVVPILEKISTGVEASEDDRLHCRATEATLRDSVRGRSLALPSVVEATTEARRRGVEVNILDDRGEPIRDGLAMQRMGEQMVTALRSAAEGSVTMRLLPEGRLSALTIVLNKGDDSDRIDLDVRGLPVVG